MTPEMISMIAQLASDAVNRANQQPPQQQQQQQPRDAAGRFAAAEAAAAAAAADQAAGNRVTVDLSEYEELRALKRKKESEETEKAKKGLENLESLFSSADPDSPAGRASAQVLALMKNPAFAASAVGRGVLVEASALSLKSAAAAAASAPAAAVLPPARPVVGPGFANPLVGYSTPQAAAPAPAPVATVAAASGSSSFATKPLSEVDSALNAYMREQFRDQTIGFMREMRRSGTTVAFASAATRSQLEPGAILVSASAKSPATANPAEALMDLVAQGHAELSAQLSRGAIENTGTALYRRRNDDGSVRFDY